MGKATLDTAAIENFASNLRGGLLRPDDDGYDNARKIYNARIDRRPALIARCAGVSDVIRSVDFAAGSLGFEGRDCPGRQTFARQTRIIGYLTKAALPRVRTLAARQS